jgi:opacity protein-like surface antigen
MEIDDAKITNAAGTVNLTEWGAGKNNLGWALGFGTAIQTDGNLTIDMGYRYVAMGEAQGSGVFSGSPAVASNSGARIDDLFVHALYLGLRVGF